MFMYHRISLLLSSILLHAHTLERFMEKNSIKILVLAESASSKTIVAPTGFLTSACVRPVLFLYPSAATTEANCPGPHNNNLVSRCLHTRADAADLIAVYFAI